MFNVFKKKEKAPSAGEAIQKLRETEEMLQKKSDYLEKKIGEEISIAKKNGTKNKRGNIRGNIEGRYFVLWFYKLCRMYVGSIYT